MNEIEELLNCRFIIKNKNKDKYYRIKDNIEDIKKFVTDKMGCQLIVNSRLIKLEKIPAKVESCMGILDFNSAMEYCFLCMVLSFLEGKEEQEQFVLSQLTEYIAVNIPQGKVDWTVFTTRRQLVKVMRFCTENDLVNINDGSDESFIGSDSGEVLYENTGVSRYFMRNFSQSIMEYSKLADFEKSEWKDLDEDRGIARRNRVYKKLMMSACMCRESAQDEDFEYLKYYGNRINEELSRLFDCQLQIYKSSAYLLMGDNSHIGKAFPDNRNNLSDIVLLCNTMFGQKIRDKELQLEVDETVHMSSIIFEQEVLACRNHFGTGLTKKYREELTSSEFVNVVMNYMLRLGFIEIDSVNQEVILKPMVGMVIGNYPQDFVEKNISKNIEDKGKGK